MLTKSSKNTIRAVLYLTNSGSINNKMSAIQVAKALEISAPFLAKTMQKLTKNKIVTSVKGPNGGFYLTSKNRTKTLLDIIVCIDSIEKIDSCFLGQLECNNKNPCVVHHIYMSFKNELMKNLKQF